MPRDDSHILIMATLQLHPAPSAHDSLTISQLYRNISPVGILVDAIAEMPVGVIHCLLR